MATGRRARGRKGKLEQAEESRPLPRLPEMLSAYLAPENLEDEVVRELDRVVHQHGRLVIAKGPVQESLWAQDTWLDTQLTTIESIGDAARILKGVQRNWVGYAHGHHRRSTLIEQKLPKVKSREFEFPVDVPTSPLGAYTLLDRNTLLYSATRSSPFPHGEIHFAETREPPSRAYRKLWEVFTRLGVQPSEGQRCIDMGASPGGWTWVLAELGANVRAVDKAPLAPNVVARSNVKVSQVSAFSLDPKTADRYDWFFSDVICEPKRLLAMVRRWLDADAADNFVCSVKFRGETDTTTVEALRAIPGARLMHLWHNRHELTWVRLGAQ